MYVNWAVLPVHIGWRDTSVDDYGIYMYMADIA